MTPPRVLVIGAGWAGLAAAITAHQQGAQVSLWEMAPSLGGRAKSFTSPDGHERDNGQHLLIGAYTECLRLMRLVGLEPEQLLLRTPLDLRRPSGAGLQLPDLQHGPWAGFLHRMDTWLPAPWGRQMPLVLGLLTSGQGPAAEAWTWQDRWRLASLCAQWQRQGWQCPAGQTVADLCASLGPNTVQGLIDPLCVSALNTPMHQASGQVFLRVLQEVLQGPLGASDLLIPRVPLRALWPQAAQSWLQQRGVTVHTHRRALFITQRKMAEGAAWEVHSDEGPASCDVVILACPPQEAARLVPAGFNDAWLTSARSLRFEAIATVYAQADSSPGQTFRLPRPLIALPSHDQAPAQFAFDRGALGGPPGELALVVSACPPMERAALTQAVLVQAQQALACPPLRPIQTLIEKRATFACTPGLPRPGMHVGPGLWACGDHVQGPFPATLEGAARSGQAAAQQALASIRG